MHRNFLPTGSFPKSSQKPVMGQANAKSPELHAGLPCGWLAQWVAILLLSSVHTRQEVELEREVGLYPKHPNL